MLALPMRALLVAATCLSFAIASRAAELVPRREFSTPAPQAFCAWGEHSFVASADRASEVRWYLPLADRRRSVLDLPASPVGVSAFEDSALVRLDGLDGRLVVRTSDAWNVVPVPANWRLPNTRIAGESYRILVDQQQYVLVLSAPGPGAVVGLLDFPQLIGPASAHAFGGDRAALATAAGVHVVDLSLPVNPGLGDLIAPPADGVALLDMELADRRLYLLWEGTLQVWDVTTPGIAVPGVALPCSQSRLALGERWLAAYDEGGAVVQVYDTASDLGPLPPASLAFPVTGDLEVHDDTIVARDATGLHGYHVTLDGLTDRGEAWPVLAADAMAAGDGAAWLHGNDRRYLVPYRGAPDLAVAPLPGDVVGVRREGARLYVGLAAGAVRVDDVSDREAPQTLGVIAAGSELRDLAVAQASLTMVGDGRLRVVDASDPSAPGAPADLALDGDLRAVGRAGEVAVAAAGTTAGPGLVHVVDLAAAEAPRLAATITPDLGGHAWQPLAVVVRDGRAHVLCRRPGPVVRTMVLDVADPDQPAVTWSQPDPDFWCYADGEPLAHVRPAALGPHHVAFRDRAVTVHAVLGSLLTPLATWTAPLDVASFAASGSDVLVAMPGRLVALSFADPDGVGAPSPSAPSSAAVRAVPNPFNPRTTLRFAMPVAGPATVTVFDARGRRVRTLGGTFPAGTARLAWDGANHDGLPQPSGVYLLRVTTPAGSLTGRCQLVR